MTKRREFSKKTKAAAWERAGGICEADGCDAPGEEYDHIKECWEGGDNSLSNCMLLCWSCHNAKTNEVKGLRAWGNHFRPRIVSTSEKRDRKRKPKSKIQSRGFSKHLTRKFDGTVIPSKAKKGVAR